MYRNQPFLLGTVGIEHCQALSPKQTGAGGHHGSISCPSALILCVVQPENKGNERCSAGKKYEAVNFPLICVPEQQQYILRKVLGHFLCDLQSEFTETVRWWKAGVWNHHTAHCLIGNFLFISGMNILRDAVKGNHVNQRHSRLAHGSALHAANHHGYCALLWFARSGSVHISQTGEMCRALHSLGTSSDHRRFYHPTGPLSYTPSLITVLSHVWLGLACFWLETLHKPRELAMVGWLFAGDFPGFFCFVLLFPKDRMCSLFWRQDALYFKHISALVYTLTRSSSFPSVSHVQNLNSELSLCVFMRPSEPGCAFSMLPSVVFPQSDNRPQERLT